MGVANQQSGDQIVVFSGHTGAALAATTLGAVAIQSDTLDIAAVGYRDDHRFTRDQRLVVKLAVKLFDLG